MIGLLKRTSVVTTIAVFTLVVALLGGCAKDKDIATSANSDSAVNIAVVAGDVANMPLPSTAPADRFIQQCIDTGGIFDIIVPDGKPYSAIEGPAVLGSESPDANRRKLENDAIKAACLEALVSANARTEETDLLGAIHLAKRSISQSAGSQIILIFHSGISTVGTIRTADTLGTDPAEVGNYLVDELPDLRDIAVIWFGFGDVDGAQMRPSRSVIKQQEELWRVLLSEAGAVSVDFQDDPPSDKAATSTLPVTPVEFPVPPTLPDTNSRGTYEFSNTVLQFQPDSAEFVDSESAHSALEPFVTAMLADTSLRARVTGQTASYPWDRNYALELSINRADAVADVFIKAGVDRSRIESTGIGDTANNDDDIAEDGLQIPSISAEFRRVIVEIY